MAKKPATPKAAADALKAAAPVPETVAQTPAAEVAADPAPEVQSNSDPIFAHDELLDVARSHNPKFADQGAKEDDKIYILRLIGAVGEVEDTTFDAMQTKTQEWYNATGPLAAEGKPFELPEGFTSKFGKKPATASAAKTPAEPKAPKEPKVVVPKEPKAPGITLKVRELVVTDPAMKLEVLEKILIDLKHGVKKATISTIRSDVLATLTAIKNAGFKLVEA